MVSDSDITKEARRIPGVVGVSVKGSIVIIDVDSEAARSRVPPAILGKQVQVRVTGPADAY